MIRFERDGRLAVIVITGTPGPDDVLAALLELLEDPRHTPGMIELWDYRESSLVNFNSDSLKILATKVGPYLERAAARVALVAGSDVDFGVLRMWEVYAEDGAPRTRRVFRTMDEAYAWLIEEE